MTVGRDRPGRPPAPDSGERASNLIQDLVAAAPGPLSEDLLVRAVGHFLDLDPLTARETVRHCLTAPGAVVQTGPRIYDLFERHLEGSRIRVRPSAGEIAFGFLQLTEAERCFLIPDAFHDSEACDRTLFLKMAGKKHPVEERLLYGEQGQWRLTGLGKWFTGSGVSPGQGVVLEALDPSHSLFRIKAERETPTLIKKVARRNRELLEATIRVLSGFGPGPHLLYFVMRRLLSLSLFTASPPPDPLPAVLAADARFEVAPGRSTVELKIDPLQVAADPLAGEESRYFGRDQIRRCRPPDPVALDCRSCDKGFSETEPYLVRLEGARLLAGSCPRCGRVALRAGT